MALFVVRHQHAAERCPAEDPQMGAMLLNHLSRPNVRQHGVEIQGEAVEMSIASMSDRPRQPDWNGNKKER